MMRLFVAPMLVTGFFMEVLCASELDFSIEAIYMHAFKETDHVPLKINYNKKEVQKAYEKWKKYNTGRYVYILDGNGTSYQLHELKNNLIFISNNSLELSVDIDSMRKKSHIISRPKGKGMRCGVPMLKKKRFNESLALDYRFPINRDLRKSNLCQKIKLEYEFDAKYGYVSFEKKQCMGVSNFNTSVNYAYGLLLLPKNEAYTDEVVNKVLDKYKQAWECEKKLLASKRINNEQNLTMLEKAVGKAKLECLDKYLVWDEDVSR